MSQEVKDLQELILEMGGKLPAYGVDGNLGNETKKAINSLTLPKHIKIALKEVGTKEKYGSRDNPRIVEYHSTTAGKYDNDEVPWCGSFINWVMLQSGQQFTISYPERAKSWLAFGEYQDYPTVGSLAIKGRSGGGHVCFVLGFSGNHKLLCLGGNQNNEVNIKEYNSYEFIEFRKPLGIYPFTLQSYDLIPGKSRSES